MSLTLEERARARRARLEQELNRWLPLLIAHEQPDKIIFVREEIVAKGKVIYERGKLG